MGRATRPSSRRDFEIAILCALPIEADAVVTLFDHDWDEGDGADHASYDKAPGDSNAYSTGRIGRHDVVVAHMPGMGKASAATVAAHCRTSWPNIKLALVVGICGAVPFDPQSKNEVILGDVIISDGVIQYDFGRRLPEQFSPKDTLRDLLGKPNTEIRSLLAKLKVNHDKKKLLAKMSSNLERLQAEPELKAEYPGAQNDRLFDAKYRHTKHGETCDSSGCNDRLVRRNRLDHNIPQLAVHFGLVASGDTVMRSGEERDRIAKQENVIAFEMEGAGLWDTFPCIIIKGACDYADSHKMKAWQRYAAATAAACAKAFLEYWIPSLREMPADAERPKVWSLIPYAKNNSVVPREAILGTLQQQILKSTAQVRVSLFGLGGTGKTQIALEYAYWIQENHDDVSVFWAHASTAERFRESYMSLALRCKVPGCDDAKADIPQLVKKWLESENQGRWLMVIDNADDADLFRSSRGLSRYIPECNHVSLLITTRDKQAGLELSKNTSPVEVPALNEGESKQLLRMSLNTPDIALEELSELSERLEHLPLALVQAAAFIEAQTITVSKYLKLLKNSEQNFIGLLGKGFDIVGQHSEALRAVAETWIVSFKQIQRQSPMAAELLSLMSLFDRQAVAAEFLRAYLNKRSDEWSELELTKALGRLKAFSLITETEDDTFDMHRLVQLVTRNWLKKKGTIQNFASHALTALSYCYPWASYENWVVCSKYLPHAYSVLEVEGTGSEDEIMGKAGLLHNISAYFTTQCQWGNAEKFLLEVVQIQRAALGCDHPKTLPSVLNLASIYRKQGRWDEAEQLQTQVMETTKAKLGADHSLTLACMAKLSLTYTRQGRFKKAEKLEVKVMKTTKTKLGADHPDTLTLMHNLATTYILQGRFKKAEKLAFEVMKIRKTKLGTNHPLSITSTVTLAIAFRQQGRVKEAEKLLVEAMKTAKTTFGVDHPNTLLSKHSLAMVFARQGRLEEAEKLLVEVMETNKTKFGADHPNTLMSMNNLAIIWFRQGRKEAIVLMQDCVHLLSKKLGPHHPHTKSSEAALKIWKALRWIHVSVPKSWMYRMYLDSLTK